MAQLHQLLFGKSKKRMHVIMIDERHKCENYMNARTANNGAKGCGGWHKIELAPPNSNPWRQKSATRNGNKPNYGTRRHGEGLAGYISKNGFNAHT
jgi:hypothetical protein